MIPVRGQVVLERVDDERERDLSVWLRVLCAAVETPVTGRTGRGEGG